MFVATLVCSFAYSKNSKRDEFVVGETTHFNGRRLMTWALVDGSGEIKEVGVTIPLALFEQQPDRPGEGPAGAIASLAFPKIVQQATYFNHFELHSMPHGHPAPPGATDPNRYAVPHFDLHFYNVPQAIVWQIPASAMPPPVPADLLPAGYLQPGRSEAQMGRHAAPVSALTQAGPLTAEMVVGYLPSGSAMHFLEPMLSRAALLQAKDIELPVPRPAVFGRTMLYPEKFTAEYDRKGRSYHFVFRQFVLVERRPSTDEATIRSLEAEESAAVLNRDFQTLERVWSDRFFVNNPNNLITPNKTVVLNLFRSGVTGVYSVFERHIERIEFDGDHTIVMGGETVVPQYPLLHGQTVQRRFTHIWKIEGGVWRLLARHANNIPAVQGTPGSVVTLW